MARKPRSLITFNIPAKDGEFVYADSGLPFSGKYHIISGVAYAGENDKSYPQPVPLDEVSTKFNPFASIIASVGLGTAAYNMVKQNVDTAKNLVEKYIPSKPKQSNEVQLRSGIYYFAKKSNDPNNIIKEIKDEESNKTTITSLQRDPLYKITAINFSVPDLQQQIEEGEKIIPGLKTFVNL
jgi:hypothetical protein